MENEFRNGNLSQNQSLSMDDSLSYSLPRFPRFYSSSYPSKGFNTSLSPCRVQRESLSQYVRYAQPFRENKSYVRYPSECSRGEMDLMVCERRGGIPYVATEKDIERR